MTDKTQSLEAEVARLKAEIATRDKLLQEAMELARKIISLSGW